MSYRLLLSFSVLVLKTVFPETVSGTNTEYISIEFPGAIRLKEDARYWEDTTNAFSIHEVLSSKIRFEVPEKKGFDLGFSPYTKWVRFKLENYGASHQKIFVLIDNSRIESLRGFLVYEGEVVKEYPATGWGTPFKERPFPFYKHIFPIDAAPHNEITVYFAAHCKYQPVETPIGIWGYEKIYKNYYASIIGDGFFYIVLLFAFLISVFAYIDSSYREWTSFWYVCYCINVFLYYFSKFGIQYFITEKLPAIFIYWIDIFFILFSAFYYFFGMTFMSSVPIDRKIRNYSYWMVICSTAICLFSYFIKYDISGKTILFWRGIMMLGIFSGLLYTIVVGLKNRNRYAIFFVAMLTPLTLMWISATFSTHRMRSGGIIDFIILQKAIISTETCLMLISAIYKNWQHKKTLQSEINTYEKQILLTQLRTQNSERNRVAQDLHDDLGGIIATLGSRLSRLKSQLSDHNLRQEMESIANISQKAGDRIRQIAHNLMPPEFEKAGLTEALREYVSGIDTPVFTFSAFGKERRFSTESELNVYRLVSELVQNIRKHAGAARADIQLFFHEDMLSIVIEDDGIARDRNDISDEEGSKAGATGLGHTSIQARLEYLHARLITDRSEKGTTVILEVPYA